MTALNQGTVEPVSFARRPRALIKINGALLASWTKAEVTTNAHYQSDTWSFELPMNGQPATSDFLYWSSWTDMEIEILSAKLDQNDALVNITSLIVGLPDEAEADPDRGIITISGRDYSSLLIETQTEEKFQNQTSSNIATTLAARHGLTPNVTPTTTKVGKYFGEDYAENTRKQTEWDLLTFLAQKEDFQVLIRGKTLFFGPPPSLQSTPYVFRLKQPTAEDPVIRANFKRAKFRRALTLARDVIVTVQSHDYQTGKSVKQTVKSVNTLRQNRGGNRAGPQTYVFDLPGLTGQQALLEAQKRLQLISLHERVIEITAPGDSLITMQTLLRLEGTSTDFDQSYFADRIERRLSFEGGDEMTIHAKNHSTVSQVPTL